MWNNQLSKIFSISGPAHTSTSQGNGGTPTETPSTNNQHGPSTAIIIATVVVVLVLIVVLAVVIIVLVVVIRLRKYKQKSEVHELQNVVLETKEEEKETESYMDDGYDVVGVKISADSAAVMDTLYSNPGEAITDETYSHLQDSQKQKVTPPSMATIGCEYSQLNYNQNDSVFQKNGPSTQQQEPTGVGMLYAVPDKKKKCQIVLLVSLKNPPNSLSTWIQKRQALLAVAWIYQSAARQILLLKGVGPHQLRRNPKMWECCTPYLTRRKKCPSSNF